MDKLTGGKIFDEEYQALDKLALISWARFPKVAPPLEQQDPGRVQGKQPGEVKRDMRDNKLAIVPDVISISIESIKVHTEARYKQRISCFVQ